jgi:hypothetical protein
LESVLLKALEAKQFQPMRMSVVVQQFCGAFADAFGSVATPEAAVVEKETQQMQIIVADMSAKARRLSR